MRIGRDHDTGIGEVVRVLQVEPLDEPVPAPRAPAVPQKAEPVRLRPVAERDAALRAHYAAQRKKADR